jgi:hypothetical protein
VKVNGVIYEENLSSIRTGALFIVLTLLFLGLFGWRWLNVSWSGWITTLLCIFMFFLFCSLNYKTLKIRITSETLRLTFGIITWKIAITNIDTCYTDETSLFRIGGAGLHFTWIKGKYRAFWNFLEYPRVVLSLKKKHGVVREIAFSTRHPEQIMQVIQSGLG